MPSVMEHLKKSVDLHRAGRLDEAEQLYRDLVRLDPGHADAPHLCGGTPQPRGSGAGGNPDTSTRARHFVSRSEGV